MGENKGGHDHHNDAAKTKDEGKGLTVVFKVSVNCEDCRSKIVKAAHGMAGVKSVNVDWEKNKLSVVGDMDPVKLRDKLKNEFKKKKKIELVSLLPVQKEDQKHENKKPEGEKKADDSKSKEDTKPQATVGVFKIHHYCDACTKKIHLILEKIDDVVSVSFDNEDLVSVKGTMDVKSIQELLQKEMKRTVDIILPKISDGKQETQANINVMIGPSYPSYYPPQNAMRIFSDDNPNACSVM